MQFQHQNRDVETVKRYFWANNVRATSESQEDGFLLVDNRYKVRVIKTIDERPTSGCDFFAVVFRRKNGVRVRIYRPKELQHISGFAYHIGRLGLEY